MGTARNNKYDDIYIYLYYVEYVEYLQSLQYMFGSWHRNT